MVGFQGQPNLSNLFCSGGVHIFCPTALALVHVAGLHRTRFALLATTMDTAALNNERETGPSLARTRGQY